MNAPARLPKRLPPPTEAERDQARAAAIALRAALADRTTMGEHTVMHVDLARPRRGVRYESWANLPGFWRVNGRGGHYRHDCLPGWQYRRFEVRTEMIPDLEALAERGERPTEATGVR